MRSPRPMQISASLMCCNILELGNEIKRLQQAGCDSFHIDIIDGHFADNLAMSFYDIQHIKKIATLPLQVHLMVENPEKYLDLLIKLGVTCIILHIEACHNIRQSLIKISLSGLHAGIAISPETLYFPEPSLLQHIDMLQFLSVKPGFAGQEFIASTIEKVAQARSSLNQLGYQHLDIQVDGCINAQTIPPLYKAGARSFVAGSSGLFCGTMNYKKNINLLRSCVLHPRQNAFIGDKNAIDNDSISKSNDGKSLCTLL